MNAKWYLSMFLFGFGGFVTVGKEHNTFLSNFDLSVAFIIAE